MRPEIRRVYSSDVDDLMSWVPNDLESVYFSLELNIGLTGDMRSDMFQVMIATPEAIRARPELGPCISGRHYLLVREYDWSKILSEINRLVSECVGEDWAEIAKLLSRTFHWEFEDYRDESEES